MHPSYNPHRLSLSFLPTNHTAWFCRLCLCAFLLFSSFVVQSASKDDLKGVSDEISRQTRTITEQQKKLNNLQGELKHQETNISKIEQDVASTQKELTRIKKVLTQLVAEQKVLIAQQAQQTETLKTLVQAYYMTNKSHALPMLLQKDEIEEKDRISQYFQHLAKARTEAIEALATTQQSLEQKEKALSSEEQEYANLLARQQSKRDDLKKNQQQRQSTLNAIKKNIRTNEAKLAELRRNEARLKAEIAKAAKRNLSPMNGLSAYRKKLPWPVKGKVLHDFGTSQSGQLTWKGLVINAKPGEAVKAVHSGRVVFAEWLRGYGLVILLDHGKGDMTLYGYNQSLLKKDGDVVQAGETIARAGNTGGQTRSALYFEIRRNSQPNNPRSWLK